MARLCTVAANSGQLPAHGGDRPHVIVTLDYDTLLTGLGTASYLDDGSRLSAREARRLACDADLIPMVLGAAVGRSMSAGRAGTSPSRSAPHSPSGTAAAPSPAATHRPRPATGTTPSPGKQEASPASPSESSCVATTTASQNPTR
ncbi:DUF222 domain-containing protein [Tessaracoccus defluvii]|uniref:DUF222 domain-containing protein n=1 Tax=Tessaracoccus defluvii TaxID=1285901 RepID=UPI001D0435F6